MTAHGYDTLRMKMYKKRKDCLDLLEAEASKLSNQARFIMEKCSGEFVVENKKCATVIDELVKRQYPPDPVQEWKRRSTETTGENYERNFKKLSYFKKYDYLLGMPLSMLNNESKNELLRQRDVKLDELEVIRRLTSEDIWRKDPNTFSEKLTVLEEKEKADELGATLKKDNKKGAAAKKINLQETMPSPSGRRIVSILGGAVSTVKERTTSRRVGKPEDNVQVAMETSPKSENEVAPKKT